MRPGSPGDLLLEATDGSSASGHTRTVAECMTERRPIRRRDGNDPKPVDVGPQSPALTPGLRVDGAQDQEGVHGEPIRDRADIK